MARVRLVYVVTDPITAWALLRGQLAYMREAGFDVTLVASPGPRLDETAAREKVKAVGVPMLRPPAPCHDLFALGRLANVLRSLRPHIVNVGTPKASLLGALAAVATRVPVRVLALRGLRAEGFRGPLASAIIAADRLVCALVHRVYCVSRSVRQGAINFGLAPPRKLTLIGSGSSNGVDASRFQHTPELIERARGLGARLRLPDGAPVVGFVGRLVRDKGVVELIDAFGRLSREFPELRLLLVGPFESYNALPAAVRSEIETNPRVVATGFLEDTAPAYALMDLLALPTYREGLPNAPLEAAAMELPVVATRVTGCVDAVVDGVTGTLVPPRDPKALADAIGKYLTAPNLLTRHGGAGRERVLREFRPERIWSALYREYVRLLRARRLPLPAAER